MPWVQDRELRFVYRLESMMDVQGYIRAPFQPKFDVGHISGGSQVVTVKTHLVTHYLALVHEARTIPGSVNRYYQHRFVELDKDGKLLMISPPFCFHDKQIEFAAGLAYLPDKQQLIASYGVRDCQAWLATMDLYEVLSFMREGQS